METFNLVGGGNIYLNPSAIETIEERGNGDQALVKMMSGANYLVLAKAHSVADRVASAIARLHGAG